MGRIIVNVMPEMDSVLDDSKQLTEQLRAAGMTRCTSVRPGRRYYIYTDREPTDVDLELVKEAAKTLIDEKTEKITGVFVGGVHFTEDDDWDFFAQGVGAIAPIPEGAGMHAPKPMAHGNVDAANLDGAADAPYLSSDDEEDAPNSDPTPILGQRRD